LSILGPLALPRRCKSIEVIPTRGRLLGSAADEGLGFELGIIVAVPADHRILTFFCGDPRDGQLLPCKVPEEVRTHQAMEALRALVDEI
jgi:hypothetical protein